MEALEECLDWHRKHGRRAKDWYAAARNWIRKEHRMEHTKATRRAEGEVLAHRARMREIEGTVSRRR
jgi:hypothetical protein